MIKITSNTVRGVTIGTNGQRINGWVPSGEYRPLGPCTIPGGRDDKTAIAGLKIANAKHGTWTVSPDAVVEMGENSTGARWAAQGDWRVVAYAEGGYCLQYHVTDHGWCICSDEDFPAKVERRLCKALRINYVA